MLERAAQSRSRLKLAVFTSIGVSVVGLTAMLIGGQGCKREESVPPVVPPVEIPPPAFDPGTSAPPSVNPAPASNNVAITPPSRIPDYVAPPPQPPVVVPPPVVPDTAVGARDYVIQKGDTFASVAKKEGVSVKAIEKANPGVDSRKLKINQKIVIPPPAAPTAALPSTTTPAPAGSEGSYVVQSGDNLSKIAKKHGVTVPALRKANHLTTDRIKVNQKLVIPPKAPGAAPMPVPAPAGGLPPA